MINYIVNYIDNFVDYILIFSVMFSFISFFVIYFTGYYFSKKFIAIFSIFVNLQSFIIVFYFVFFFYNVNFEFNFFNQFILDFFVIKWGFYFDNLTLVMMLVILSITLLVQVYCIDYMQSDIFFNKFYSYIMLFSAFMIFLVSSNNYLQSFLGQEGVGLVSFLLISFQNTRKLAVLSSLKAVFMNRIGDIFFIFVNVIFLSKYKTVNYSIIFNFDYSMFQNYEIVIISFFLIFAAIAKSAQFGLHTWLADAMEGPTPISALIHAATMVTAGIFILVRSSVILINNCYVLDFMCIIGSITVIFGASVACFQYDIKKIVAYSTISQLGYMMLGCGLGNFDGAMFHLFTHAFFKALLFLCAGSIIHSVNNEQDIRKMGGLFKFIPFTYVCTLIGFISLMGLPYFSGFYSKDYIIESCFLSNRISGYVGFVFGLIGIIFTVYYSSKSIYFVFSSAFRNNRFIKIYDAPLFMSISMFILSICSIFFGFVFEKQFNTLKYFSAVNFQFDSVYIYNTNFFFSDYIVMYNFVTKVPFIFICIGFAIFYVFEIKGFIQYINNNNFIFRFFNKKQYYDLFVNFVIKSFVLYMYKYYYVVIEKNFMVQFGPRFIINLFRIIINFFSRNFESNFNVNFMFKVVFQFCFFILYFDFVVQLVFVFNIKYNFFVNYIFVALNVFFVIIIFFVFGQKNCFYDVSDDSSSDNGIDLFDNGKIKMVAHSREQILKNIKFYQGNKVKWLF